MAKRTRAQISYNMSRIKSRGTSIEVYFRRALLKNKISFRCNKKIFGNPDFILHNKKVAIFCDSAFWHGHNFGKNKIHRFKVRKKFWMNKIKNNIARDKEVNVRLSKEGWKVFRFWDFEIKKDISKCINCLKIIKSSKRKFLGK